jgi:GNAT superfamily N-acetyltransferase
LTEDWWWLVIKQSGLKAMIKFVNIFRRLWVNLQVLPQTVHAEYGSGFRSYLKFIYYSFFSINTFNIYIFDLEQDIPRSPLPEGYHVIFPTLAELDSLRAGKDLPREFYFDKTDGLTTCQILMKGSEIAYIQWICNAKDPSRFFRLGEGVVRITNVATLPAFRGQGLMQKMFRYTLIDLKNQGYRRIVSAIHSNNIASIKSILKIGYHHVGKIRTFGRFQRKIIID